MRRAVRFDEYSIVGRLMPIEYAYNMLLQNHGFPYGLGVLKEEVSQNSVHNSYLVMAMESGAVVLLFLFMHFMAVFLFFKKR